MSAGRRHPLAPRAKELTLEEAKQRREAMFKVESGIKEAIAEGKAALWKLAAYLDVWEDQGGWLALGYEKLNDWLADPEIGISKSQFHHLVDSYRYLKDNEIEPAEIRELEHSKVKVVLPAVRQGRVKLEDAIADVKVKGWRDLREDYRDPAADAKPGPSTCAGTSKPPLPPDEEPVDDQDLQRARDEIDLLERFEKAVAMVKLIDAGINARSPESLRGRRCQALKAARAFIVDDYPEAGGNA
jgi:hypothetical protein